MLEISNLPSNLCRPAVPSTDWPSPVVCPPSSTSSILTHSPTILTYSVALHLSPSHIPPFHFSPSIHLFSISPLPDVRRAGLVVCWPWPRASGRRGISQMFGSIFIQGLWIWGEQTATEGGGRAGFRQKTEETFLHVLFLPPTGTFGVILSLFLSPTPPPPRVSFGSCLAGCDWRATLQADVNLVRVVGTGGNCGGRQMKSPSPSPRGLLLLKVDWDLCVCVRTLSVSGVRPLASPPANHVKSAQKCLLGEYRPVDGGGM